MTPYSDTSTVRRRILFGLTGVLMGSTLELASAQAETFPSRPLKFIVPFPTGSGTDTSARVFAKAISDAIGQAIIVENKPGGNGFIGVQAALNAAPDGYTVFIGSNSTLSTNAATFKKLPYDPLSDFAPLSVLSRGPCLVIVPANSPYKTLQQLVEAARKQPKKLNYGSGSVSYTLYSEWLNELTQIQTTGITYKGAGDAINAVLAGTVDFAVVDASGAIELVKGNKLRALTYTAENRLVNLPDVPSAPESGIPEFLAFNWVAAAVSSKVPPAIVQQLVALFAQAASTPEVKNFHAKNSTALVMSTPTEMRQYQQIEIARWKKLIAITGLELL